MRQKLIAGNWKMNGLKADSQELVAGILSGLRATPVSADILICPPFTLTASVAAAVQGSPICVGVQDVSDAPKSSGAYTGEISAEMAADIGATYAIVGHSERRAMYGESNTVVRAKAENVLKAGLTAIVCVGETLEERESGQALAVVGEQVMHSCPIQTDGTNLVVAYEPVWAIGTGKVPTTADVAEMHASIRARLNDLLGHEAAERVRILYGGSVKPANAAELLSVSDVDGALIGGASLKAADFLAIAETQK